MPNFNLNTEDGRAAWLAERRKHIMSTDVAAIAKMSPFSDATPLHVYLDKLGAYQRPDKKLLRYGRMMEDTCAMAYYETTGNHVQPPEETLTIHPKDQLLACTLDRTCLVKDERRVLELKYATGFSEGWGEDGTDQIPRHYVLQVQGQMACTDLPAADVGVIFPGGDFKRYTVRRNDEAIAIIIRLAHTFWAKVQARTPPEIDWSDPGQWPLINKLYPDVEDGKSIILGGDTVGLIEVLEQARLAEYTARKQKDRAKAALRERMGTAGSAICGGWEITRKPVHREGYSVDPSDYIDLRIKKRKVGEFESLEQGPDEERISA
jgi:putative phage-type endonuclease